MDELTVPEWDLVDRLRKSLRHAGLHLHEMADYLGVSRNSVSNWMNGNYRPSQPALKLWAMRTGVPYEWLRGESEQVAAGFRRPGYRFPQLMAVAA